MLFKDKVVVVTGGASGIGLHIAKSLKRKEAIVIVLDVNEEKLGELYHDFITFEVNATNDEMVEKTIKGIEKTVGPIDILVNNAGKIHSQLLVNLTDEEHPRHSYETFSEVMKANLHSAFIVGSNVAEQMIMNRKKGVIINISSIAANGNIGQTAYAAAKAGVNAMTLTWAKELGPYGIRTAAIAPGFMDTESTHKALSSNDLSTLKSQIPLRKLGQAEHIAQTIKFIVENDYITGKVIEVDGGLTL